MQTAIHKIPEMTIEAFADHYGLEMEVHERINPRSRDSRHYAHFRHAEVKQGRMLLGEYGNGSTPEDAIRDYAPRISLKTLVINACETNRREIQVPRLIQQTN